MTDLGDRTRTRAPAASSGAAPTSSPAPSPGPSPDQARRARQVERSRRRFARRQWRRRWRVWRLVLAALVVTALVAGAVHAVYFSSWLSVSDVEVRGEQTLSAAQVTEAAGVPTGGPLATADLEAVRLRVGSLAQVRGVEVTRSWPGTVVVDVVEREPVAAVAVGQQLRGLDEEGIVLTELPADSGLPRVETSREVGPDALAEAAGVVAAMPDDLAAAVDHVEVQTVDQISLELRAGALVRWGSAAQSEQKAAVLAALLREGGAAEYDVSVPGLPTTRG